MMIKGKELILHNMQYLNNTFHSNMSNFGNGMSLNMINERTPFYFVSSVFLFITIILSFISTFHINENYNDFFPLGGVYNNKKIVDDTYVDKICWYFSQITHHTILLLFFYFFMALINRKSEGYFKMVAPLALTVSALYFYFLFPRQKLKLHQLPFYNLFSHFMIIFLVFGEFIYIKSYTFQETTHCLLFLLTSLCAIFINYTLRGVWSYNLVKMDRFSGWRLISITTIVMYMFSLLFYLLKHGTKPFIGLDTTIIRKSTQFFSGFIGIIFFLIFTHYEKR
jgi:hypothetical protein